MKSVNHRLEKNLLPSIAATMDAKRIKSDKVIPVKDPPKELIEPETKPKEVIKGELQLKIVKNPKKGKGRAKVHSMFIMVDLLSELTEEQATILITDDEGNRWFDEDMSGTVIMDYPLNVTVELQIKEARSLGHLLWLIALAYVKIYEDEEKTSSSKPESTFQVGETTFLNRTDTDGIYGISMHGIEDLAFERVFIYPNGVIELGIGS